ncbi:MAG: hypothetical protein O3C54_01720 [Proteobacteria bacterium]|nr:hypothetical protein [Pseudomonadota bacterium]
MNVYSIRRTDNATTGKNQNGYKTSTDSNRVKADAIVIKILKKGWIKIGIIEYMAYLNRAIRRETKKIIREGIKVQFAINKLVESRIISGSSKSRSIVICKPFFFEFFIILKNFKKNIEKVLIHQ